MEDAEGSWRRRRRRGNDGRGPEGSGGGGGRDANGGGGRGGRDANGGGGRGGRDANGGGRGGVVLRCREEEEEQRDQEHEYLYVRRQEGQTHRPGPRVSDSVSIHFLTDDREEARGEGKVRMEARDTAEIRIGGGEGRHHKVTPMGEVDYSSNDFHQAKAAIEDAATRQRNGGPSGGRASGRRVRQFGDTTVITEHRDPYSFYWQLDQLKRAEQEVPRPVPVADYVLEEEAEELMPEGQEQEEFPEDYLSPDSGVHLAERVQREEQQYARPVKERGEDPSQFSHYWHVDSAPRAEESPPMAKRPSPPPSAHTPLPLPRHIPVTDAIQQTVEAPEEPVIEEHAFKQTTIRRRVETAEEAEEREGAGGRRWEDEEEHSGGVGAPAQSPVRFAVYPLGHVEVSEAELADVERSRKVLNGAMEQLGERDTEGEEEVILELDGKELSRWEAEKGGGGRLLGREPLEQIRVWGVGGGGSGSEQGVINGRTQNRDLFAYVSSSPDGLLLCRVFRCRPSAKPLADALRSACDSLLRFRQQSQPKRPNSPGSDSAFPAFAGHQRRRKTRQSAETPIEEPKRIIRSHFIGVTQVPRATGIDTLNEAVDRLVREVGGRERWTLVDVHISSSAICIYEAENARRLVASCRVRYLSFLGIGRDVKHFAFIVAQSSDHFVCYVFHAGPSAGPLAKTIEAACKLRYQKVLDAHLGEKGSGPNEQK